MDGKETFFSKLRHLAVRIDNESSLLQEELNSRKLKQHEQHTNAMMLLHETKKELKTVLQNTQGQIKDFSTSTSNFGKIQELVSDILNVQKIRYDQAESFMVPYGFPKPERKAPPSDVDSDQSAETNDEPEENSGADDKQDHEKSVNCSTDLHPEVGPETPKHPQAKPVEQDIMKTPQLEELFCHLSEDTIWLIKEGVDNMGQAKFGGSMDVSNYSTSTYPVKPGAHAPLQYDNRFQASEKSMSFEPENVEPPQITSRTYGHGTLMDRTETSFFCTPQGFNAETYLLTPPPMPNLLTCVLSTPECPVKPRSNKENEPVSKPSGLMATPEEPKLQSSRLYYGGL